MLQVYTKNEECLKQAKFILQANSSMLQEWFNLSQLLSPDEGLVIILFRVTLRLEIH